MFKTILVAIDGSPTAERGLQQAITLAKDQHAKLCILHVVDERTFAYGLEMPLYIEGLWDALRGDGRKVLELASADAKESGVTAEMRLEETAGRRVADVILDEAGKCSADLIVLGTHGRRGLSRLVMGSDAEMVLREAQVPVMLVRSVRATAGTRQKETVDPVTA